MQRRLRPLLSLLVFLTALLLGSVATAQHEEPSQQAAVVATASASASASGSASAAPKPEKHTEAVVRLKDRKVFALTMEREGRMPVERARIATQELEHAFDSKENEAHFEKKDDVAIVFVGKIPVVELTSEDAQAAGASTIDAYAADVTAKTNAAIKEERKRSAIANTVFSVSLVVFSALIAFLLLGKASQLGTRAREWVEDNPERIPALKLGGIELLRPAAIEAFLTLGIDVLKRIAQFGILYAWIIFSLSLFEATKGYTDKLTALVLGPVGAFFTRIGAGLPLAVVTLIAVLAIALLVRFTGVFFAGVARGETTIDFVPQDLAQPVGVVVRIGLVVAAMVLAAPLLTGSDDGALSRAGMATLIAFGLAATPLLACGIVGSIAVFGRKLRPGDFVEVAGRTGRIRSITLLEVAIEDDSGCEVRVPHLLGLWHPTRVMGASPVVTVELVVDSKASQTRVRDVLGEAAQKVGNAVKVDLVSIDADGALYRVTVGVATALVGPIVAPTGRRLRSSPGRLSVPPAPRIITLGGVGNEVRPAGALGVGSTVQLTSLLADALAKEGIALGRRFAGARA
ncbi:MAG: mechanosensitive ion channel domain-containing protein [Polyangiales bacterium]